MRESSEVDSNRHDATFAAMEQNPLAHAAFAAFSVVLDVSSDPDQVGGPNAVGKVIDGLGGMGKFQLEGYLSRRGLTSLNDEEFNACKHVLGKARAALQQWRKEHKQCAT